MLGPNSLTNLTVGMSNGASGTGIVLFPGDDLAFKSNSPMLRASWNDPKYSKKSLTASLEAAAELRRDRSISCYDLYAKAASVRAQMAHESAIAMASLFGSFRQSWQQLETSLDRVRTEEDGLKSRYGDQWTTLFTRLLSNPNTTLINGFFILQVTFHEIPLSTISCPVDLTKWEEQGSEQGLYIRHAPPESYAQLQEHIEPIFSLLKTYIDNPFASEQEVFYLLGKLYWIYAHACPLCRGSASTTERISRSISKAIFPEKPLPIYKEGCSPDLLAIFCSDIEIFARSYQGLFSNDPVVEEPYQDVVKRVLKEQVPNYRNYGWSELEVVTSCGQRARVKELLAQHDRHAINAKYHGHTLLESALTSWTHQDKRDPSIVEALLKGGADPTADTIDKLLEFAIYNGTESLVETLLSLDISLDLNTQCHEQTFLEQAIAAMVTSKTKHSGIVEKLLEKGATLSTVPWDRVVEMAILTGRKALALQILSTKNRRDLTSRWHHGSQLLKLAIEALIKGIRKDADIIKWLFNQGLDVRTLSEDLHHLEEAFNSENGAACKEIFKILSKALLRAAVLEDPQLLEYILSKNPEIDINAQDGMLLNLAVYHADYMQLAATGSIQVLLDKGAAWPQDSFGKIVCIAISLEKWDLVKEKLSKITAISGLESYRRKFVLEHALDSIIQNKCTDLSLLTLLLEKGADPACTISTTMLQLLTEAALIRKNPVCVQALKVLFPKSTT